MGVGSRRGAAPLSLLHILSVGPQRCNSAVPTWPPQASLPPSAHSLLTQCCPVAALTARRTMWERDLITDELEHLMHDFEGIAEVGTAAARGTPACMHAMPRLPTVPCHTAVP